MEENLKQWKWNTASICGEKLEWRPQKEMEDDLKNKLKWKTTSSTIKKINLDWMWHNSKLT